MSQFSKIITKFDSESDFKGFKTLSEHTALRKNFIGSCLVNHVINNNPEYAKSGGKSQDPQFLSKFRTCASNWLESINQQRNQLVNNVAESKSFEQQIEKTCPFDPTQTSKCKSKPITCNLKEIENGLDLLNGYKRIFKKYSTACEGATNHGGNY